MVTITKKVLLSVYHYDIESEKLPSGFDGFRILHLSDLHSKTYGKNGEHLIDACEEFLPDMIVFTGDLFSRGENIFALRNKIPLMSGLRKLAPVYYVWGNHEAAMPGKSRLLSDMLREKGVVTLRNEKVRISVNGGAVNLYGLELEEAFYKNPDGSYKNLPQATEETLTDRLGRPDLKSYNILLSHTPFPFRAYAGWGADFTMSGHCHGGIIRLPGEVGLLSPERKFFPKYTKGVYSMKTPHGEALMEVSAGLGKFRINNPESISLCVLRKTDCDNSERRNSKR